MRLWRALHITLLAASSAGATTIDVSADINVVVRTGDTLIFRLLTSNFSGNAARLGLPQSPTQLDFALVSTPLAAGGEFAATLESADGSVAEAFGDLTFHSGFFQASGYTGEVSILQGFLPLDSLLSERLWSGPFVELALRNDGPDTRLGLAPYVLQQDLYASLSGGALSVGAVPYMVDLEGRPNRSITLARVANGAFTAEVPETATGGLLLGGGVLLWAFWALLTRVSGSPVVRR